MQRVVQLQLREVAQEARAVTRGSLLVASSGKPEFEYQKCRIGCSHDARQKQWTERPARWSMRGRGPGTTSSGVL